MTIICYKDGVLAADSGQFVNGVNIGYVDKIVERDGALAAASGESCHCRVFEDWFLAGRVEPLDALLTLRENDEFAALIVERDRSLKLVSRSGRVQSFSAPFVAIGFCYEMALGAMMAGAGAVRAVFLCIGRSNYVAGPVLHRSVPEIQAAPDPEDAELSGLVEPVDLTTEYFSADMPGVAAGWRDRMGLTNGEDA